MDNLNELVVNYKKTKNSQILNKIFKLLAEVIHDKATFVFSQQKFQAKGYKFRLKNTNKLTVEDVEQYLNLFTLELIKRCDNNKPFDKYFFSSIWHWHPKFINKDFLNQLKNFSIFDTDFEDDNVKTNKLDILRVFPKFEEKLNLDEMFDDLTVTEKKLLNIILKTKNQNQSELADILGVSQSYISRIFENLKKKYRG
jgi:RNA polymerase sigma factor (sigma-70 family)